MCWDFLSYLIEMQYAHSLLFVCTNCKSPIVVGCLSAQKTLESVDELNFAATCAYCKYSFNLPAVTAKKHYVEEWPHQGQ